jgi:hypothetical protein
MAIRKSSPTDPGWSKAKSRRLWVEGVPVSEPMPLFSESEMGDFRSQWSNVQTKFVDERRRTVEDADKLGAAVMQRLAEGFANERSGLEKQWGTMVTTCPLRTCASPYSVIDPFFDRLLKL